MGCCSSPRIDGVSIASWVYFKSGKTFRILDCSMKARAKANLEIGCSSFMKPDALEGL